MKLIDHINLYYGTEFETVAEFIKDLKHGDLSTDYEDDSEKLTQLLMFLVSYSRQEEGA